MNAIIGNLAIVDSYINNQEFQGKYFQRFIEFCDCKQKTIENYKVFLKNFAEWIQDNQIHNPTRADIKAYKKYLEESNLAIGTKQQYFQSVKLFFKWLSCEKLYPNITEGMKSFKVNSTETQKEAFTEEELQTILSSIDRTTIQGKRNFAMLLLTITGGLRIIELQRANIGDIQERNRQKVIYIQGKGKDSKDEYIKIIPEVENAINEYLQTRTDLKKNDPLFVGTSNRAKNERFTETSLSRLFKTIFKNCGFDSSRLTAHSLRHSSNTLLFNSGADIYKVQKHARHSQVQTTERYIHSFNRANDTSEQEIFNQLFQIKQSKVDEVISRINELSEEDKEKVRQYLVNNCK